MVDQIEFVSTNLFRNDSSKDIKTQLQVDFWEQCKSAMVDIKADEELFTLMQELYIENFCAYLSTVFESSPSKIWGEFRNCEMTSKNPNSQHLHLFKLVQTLYELHIGKWLNNPFIDLMFAGDNSAQRQYMARLQDVLYSAFIAEMPLKFNNFLLNTFTFCFKVFDHINQSYKENTEYENSANESKLCVDCGWNNELDPRENCWCISLRAGFIAFRNTLQGLGMFDRLCEDIIRSVIFTSIEKYIYHLCEGNNFDVSCLDLTLNWFENNLIDWIRMVYLTKAENDVDIVNVIVNNITGVSPFRRLRHPLLHEPTSNYARVLARIPSLSSSNIRNFIINTYIYCRMKQLFEIVIDYPYSEAVLLDLHECIKIDPFYRTKFINTLKSSIELRLLHPGVGTSEIIDAYITSIKALRLLDPQGIILQIVCDPVRNYLKSREDTVRCIITSLTNENLNEYNISEPAMEIPVPKERKDDDELVLDSWKTWHPQPIGVSKLNKSLISADIISMLVNIFDSKDLFVQEYQRLLSQRLLMSFEVNQDMEHRNLELLSLRFGESELHTCEVMLKDIKDSERVNQRINAGEVECFSPRAFDTNGLILSQQFWPENLGFAQNFEELKVLTLPDEVKDSFDAFTKAFETIKANRTLNWVHQLGVVKLELELDNGRTVEFTVRPIQAAIIYQFQKRKLWRISELGEELTVPPSVIRRHIGYWQSVGLLVEVSADTFLLDEEGRSSSTSNQQSLNTSQEFDHFESEHTEDDHRQSANADDNRLQIFWNFIDNMLKNLSSLSLDRIFAMLKMFNMQSPEIESLTKHDLKQFLDRKVAEDKLVYASGLYSLRESD